MTYDAWKATEPVEQRELDAERERAEREDNGTQLCVRHVRLFCPECTAAGAALYERLRKGPTP